MLKQKVSFKSLLLITFAFLITTLLTQWILVYASNKIELQSVSDTNIFIFKNTSTSKCNCLNLELKDLHRIKVAYLNELKKLELKRKNKLKLVEHLNQQITGLKLKLDKLNSKHTNLNLKLINDLATLNNLHSKSQQELNQIRTIELIKSIQNTSYSYKHKCNSDKCFNYNKCDSNRLRIFFFNSSLKSSGVVLDQTENPLKACLVLIVLKNKTNLDYYKLLASFLKDYQNDQLNLVFINTIENSFDTLNDLKSLLKWDLTRSIYASFAYNSNVLFSNMFIHFSLISNKDYFQPFHSVKSYFKRKYTLTCFHSNSFDLLEKYLNNQVNVLVELNSKFNLEERLTKLCDSKFTLIIQSDSNLKWSIENTYNLIEALKCGSLPILIESDLKLPLDNLIAWDEFVLRLPLSKLSHLVPLLIGFNSNEFINRQIKATNVYQSYFSSETAVLQTLLAAIQFELHLTPTPIKSIQTNEILDFNSKTTNVKFNNTNYMSYNDEEIENEEEYLGEIDQKPQPSLDYINNVTVNKYLMWNKYYYPFNQFPSTPFDSNIHYPDYDQFTSNELDFIKSTNYSIGGYDGKYFHHRLGSNYVEEQFTIVILTYNRENYLINLVEKYIQSPYLHSILIIWNSIEIEPTKKFETKFKTYLESKRIRIVRMSKNSLNNRFLPLDLIKTDAILSLDDDTSLRLDEIIFAFRVWRTNRDQIVGFPARFHSWNFNLNNYIYNSSLSCEYSMILTGAAFYHRFYNYYFTYAMNSKIRSKIDELNNCEDIAFNMMVAHLTRKPPVKVTTKFRFFCPECETDNEEKISLKKDHYSNRSFCIQYFSSIYSYNPLMYSQHRADSVLYKTKLNDDKQKCFKYI